MKAVVELPGGVFYFILNMSITAALMVILLLIVRIVSGRRISRSFTYPLWVIVLFRLLIPVSLQSRFSLISLVSGYMTRTVAIPIVPEGVLDFSALNTIRAANEYFPLQYKSHIIKTAFDVSGIIWLCGAALFIIASAFIYKMTASELNKAVLIKDNDTLIKCRERMNIKRNVMMYKSSLVSSPVVFGIFKPRIIIPEGIPEDILEYALLHELSHIKHFDNLFKFVSAFAACIHWFNPFAWLFLYMVERDMEFVCDERILKVVSNEYRRHYAKALVELAAKQQAALTAFGSTAVRMRIVNIMEYRRMPLLMAAAAGVICAGLAVLLITNPV